MLVEADNAEVRGLTSPQRDRGRLTATTAPVSLPSFSFCELPQDGLREDGEVCPVRGAAVCRPVRATLHRHAEVCCHRCKGQNISTTPRRRQHCLLVDRGLLYCLCDLHCPAGLGTPEVYGVHEEEISHREEEVVSFSDMKIENWSELCMLSSWDPSAVLRDRDMISWFEAELACDWFGQNLAG